MEEDIIIFSTTSASFQTFEVTNTATINNATVNGTLSVSRSIEGTSSYALSAVSSSYVSTVKTNAGGTYYPLFVDSNNSSPFYEQLYNGADFLTYNPGEGILTSKTFANVGSGQINNITSSYAITASYAMSGGTIINTSSFLTTGSSGGTQTISGSLTINQNLIVLGSASITNISQSTLNIGTNLITVNTQTPGVRFGGLAVIDSGSSPQRSGSILFDSTNDQWIFVHQNTGGAITSSIFIQTPQTFNNVGNETNLTTNRVPKSTNAEHIGDSNITDTGTIIQLGSATQVTGSLNVSGGITGSLLGTASFVSTLRSTGSIGSIQYANNGVLGSSTNLNYNGTNLLLQNGKIYQSDGTTYFTVLGKTGNVGTNETGVWGYDGDLDNIYPITSYDIATNKYYFANYSTTYDGATGFLGIGTSTPAAKLHVLGNITASGNITAQTNLVSANSTGDEGGEILLYKSVTNNSLTGSGITIDSYQNKLRFFEQGGNARGAYLDITTLGNGVGTNLQKSSNYFYDAYLINAQTTAAGVDTTINNISLVTRANEAWSFEFTAVGQCSGTGGVRFTVVYSATPVSSSVTYWGNSTQVGNMSSATTILTTPAQSGTIWATATPIDVQATIRASFVNAGNANTVTIKVQPTNGAQTATLRAMAYLTARRIL
jgi:hypothetical protein